MKRREFLKNTSLASSLFFVPSFVKAFENIAKDKLGFKRLVIIQLSGGNDGLNTVVPFSNDLYYTKRKGIALPTNSILKLNDDLGLHESLAPLKSLYDKGYLSIINNVGYPNPNRSHFRSTDIWHTATDSDNYSYSGWIGRYLDKYGEHPYNTIEVDDSLSLALKGETQHGIATKNANLLFKTSQEPFFNKIINHQNDTHLSEHNLGYLYKTMIAAQSSAKYIYQTSKTQKSSLEYPKGPFAQQLKTTAEFINSGLDTKVFYTSLGGFDTHVNQLGRQKKLLNIYAEGVESFVKDLQQQHTFKDTLILTFSEFGRRVSQNAAGGTDHGAANNVFIIGENLKKQGIYNSAPNLSTLDGNGDLIYEIDFRQIYATVLNKWLGVDDKKILFGKSFDTLDFI